MNFDTYFSHPDLAAGITAAGYSTPTPIQRKAIPVVMKGRDVMGLAQTGTGKTAAFVLPILHRLLHRPSPSAVRALVVAPTRELAEQIHQAFGTLGARTGLRSVPVYGGVGFGPQTKAFKTADIIVACPGRLLDHLRRQTVNLSKVEMLVLDEADQMLDMGFLPDIRRILSHLPRSQRQNLLFSATMPDQLRKLAHELLSNPARIEVGHQAPAETVSHAFYPVEQYLKTALLLKLLGSTNASAVLIFTRTKHKAKQLDGKLAKAGYRSASLQGNLSQSRRQDAMRGFKSGKYKVLVATDIAARGIDVSNVSHVINYDMPSTAETYIHRIGRTGRAKRNGEAYTLITEKDRQMARAIRSAIGKPVEDRTISDFDYDVPARSGRGGAAHQRPKQNSHPKSRRRKARQGGRPFSSKQGRKSARP